MEIFKRDRQFWGAHGGVTFSGGEPLFQQEFMLSILKKCREQYIHTAVETTTYFMEAMKYVEWVFSDLKKNMLRFSQNHGKKFSAPVRGDQN